MDIQQSRENKFTVYASDYARLDSNVYTGGGTDDTDALQAVLDKAAGWGRLRLVMDGAALVRGLKLYSNTTIECMDKDCGFFLKDQSNCAVVTNYNWNFKEIQTRNIALLGGTYNQDCLHQVHDRPVEDDGLYPEDIMNTDFRNNKWTFGLEFYGVENLQLRDLTIRNQRTFALAVANWKHVNIDNVWIDLPDRLYAQNQDGFHFWGPGQFLNIHNVGGRVGDDFMNIGPDELDGHSDITDVLIDGVFLDDADQGIRLLSRGTGRLDRVTIRNVTGTYNSFGFYVNPWFPDVTYGNVGNILFENIDLRQTKPTYDYTPAFLFRLGGNIENVTFRNITHHCPVDNRTLFQIGIPFYDPDYQHPQGLKPVMESLVFDGIHILEKGNAAADCEYVQIQNPIRHVVMRNVEVIRCSGEPKGTMIAAKSGCDIETLQLQHVYVSGMEQFLTAEEGHIQNLVIHHGVCHNMVNGMVKAANGVIDHIVSDEETIL